MIATSAKRLSLDEISKRKGYRDFITLVSNVILGSCALKIKPLDRRQFLLQGFATLSTTLLLKACTSRSNSAKESTNSGFGDTSKSLQFISIPPKNGQVPAGLIVCLHGYGGNAQDLASKVPALNLPKYQFLFPDAPFPHPSESGGRQWYNLESQDDQGLISSRQRLTDWLKSLESTTGIPLSRTILSGFSQGGAMTLDVGFTLPLAGLVSLSGYLHSKPKPSAGESFPPVLIIHGRQDRVVPLGEAQRARDSLRAVGVPVRYQEFDMGHEIQPAVLAVMRNFVVDAIK